MVTEHNLDCFDEFTSRFIRRKVRKLVGRAGLTKSDAPDLFQEFAIDLVRRRPKFDPDKASWEAFVVVVCENRYATILAHRCAEKRSYKREAGSLNRPIKDPEGNRTDLGSTIPVSQQARRTGQQRRTDADASDLAHDVADALDQMPPLMRELCELLKYIPKTEAARELGITRSRLYEIQAPILKRFENANLRDYLQ